MQEKPAAKGYTLKPAGFFRDKPANGRSCKHGGHLPGNVQRAVRITQSDKGRNFPYPISILSIPEQFDIHDYF